MVTAKQKVTGPQGQVNRRYEADGFTESRHPRIPRQWCHNGTRQCKMIQSAVKRIGGVGQGVGQPEQGLDAADDVALLGGGREQAALWALLANATMPSFVELIWADNTEVREGISR